VIIMAVPCGAVPASAASTITGPAGLGLIAAWIHRDNEEFDGLLGNDEGAEEILPVAIGEQITALERLAGPDEVRRQIDGWLEERRTRLAGSLIMLDACRGK
jgi:hypothetical protein